MERRRSRRLVRAAALLAGLPGLAGLAFAAPSNVSEAEDETASAPANVVFIVTDDQRWDQLEFPDGTLAMPIVESELAGHGVTFENAFVANPVCCPSRASILTGNYSHTTGVYENVGAHAGFASFDDTSTVATWLHDAGYQTALVGKYLNGYVSPTSSYIPPGWDRWFAFTGRNGEGGYYDYSLSVDGTLEAHGDAPADYSTDVLAAEADLFIRSVPEAQPLFLYFAPKAPHEVAIPAPRHAGDFAGQPPYRPPSYNEHNVDDKPGYIASLDKLTSAELASIDASRLNEYRSLEAVDDAVGDVLAALEETNRLSNTLIVFTSDNGLTWAEHRWDRGKTVPYEEAIRVPMIVRFDPVTSGPSTDPHFVLNIDLAATAAEAAQIVPPVTDGQSLLPLLSDPGALWRDDFLIEHWRARTVPKYCGVRTDGFSYVAYDTGEEELYDLAGDGFQLQNVADAPGYESTLEALRARMSELCDPPPPPLELAAPQGVPLGQSVIILGELSFPLAGKLPGETIHVTQTAPDGTETALADVVTDGAGAFEITALPAVTGMHTFTATWDGSPTQEPAAESVKVMATNLTSHSDFNNDGYEDVAIGIPSEDVGGIVDAGAVEVLYGTPTGLQPEAHLWSQGSDGLLGTAGTGDAFGSATAAGDFNGDGFADLAVGAPTDDEIGEVDAGIVSVILGSSSGLTAEGNTLWSMPAFEGGIPMPGDLFGRSLIACGFRRSGFSDLAIGVPGRDVSGAADAGLAANLRGGATGLDEPNNALFTQNTPDVPDAAEPGDKFGSTLACGDFDGNGYSDLAVGSSLEDVGTAVNAGSVTTLMGSPVGLTGMRSAVFTQESSGIPDTAETSDQFSSALAAADFNGDGEDDLAVAAPGEDRGTLTDGGLVNVIYGSPAGLTGANAELWGQDSAGIADQTETGDRFGSTLSASNLYGGDFAELVVGVPNEDLAGVLDAGAIHVLPGTAGGLTSTGSLAWSEGADPVGDLREARDQFPGALQNLDVNADGFGDIVAGIPFEDDPTGAQDAGALSIVYGGPGGVGTGGGVFLFQGDLGGPDAAEVGDQYGWSVATRPNHG